MSRGATVTCFTSVARWLVIIVQTAALLGGCEKPNNAPTGAAKPPPNKFRAKSNWTELTYSDTGSLYKTVEEVGPGITGKVTIFAEDGTEVIGWNVQVLDAFHDLFCISSNKPSFIRYFIRDRGEATEVDPMIAHGLAATLGNDGEFISVSIFHNGMRETEVEIDGEEEIRPSSSSLSGFSLPSDGCKPWVLSHPVSSDICDSKECYSTDSYYPSGEVKRRDIYCGDTMVHSVWYMPSGLPVLETAWGGGRNGMNFELNDDGRLVMFEQIRSGVRHGSRVTLDVQGRFATVKYFENGQLVNTHDFEYD